MGYYLIPVCMFCACFVLVVKIDVKNFRRVHEVFDFVYFNFTQDGREFLRLCKLVHHVSEEIIEKRREAIVSVM